jgi:polyhydroxyalkanoate synthesis regulator protein
MQGFMGSYLEKNIQAFMDMQTKMWEQTKACTPEMLGQFMSCSLPCCRAMGNYAEQSKTVFDQMQEQMQKQAEQMLGAFKPKRLTFWLN